MTRNATVALKFKSIYAGNLIYRTNLLTLEFHDLHNFHQTYGPKTNSLTMKCTTNQCDKIACVLFNILTNFETEHDAVQHVFTT